MKTTTNNNNNNDTNQNAGNALFSLSLSLKNERERERKLLASFFKRELISFSLSLFLSLSPDSFKSYYLGLQMKP